MRLKKLTIELRPSWADNAGKYTGEISYEGETGKVELQLDPEVSNALLICIGQTITEFASKAAEQVRDSLILSVAEAKNVKTPAIENS